MRDRAKYGAKTAEKNFRENKNSTANRRKYYRNLEKKTFLQIGYIIITVIATFISNDLYYTISILLAWVLLG